MRRYLTVLVLVATAATCLGGTAAAGERVLLFGPGVDEETLDRAERLWRRMAPGGEDFDQRLALAEAVTLPAGPVVYGDVLLHECAGTSIAPDHALEMIEQGMGDFRALEYAAAIASFERAEAMLPCLAGFLPAGKVSDLYFFHGLAAFYDQDEAAARSLFARSLSSEPSRPWDDRYPPKPQQAFLDAGKAILHIPPRPMRVADPAGEIQTIQVDSREWVGFPDVPLDLTPGWHLVQWKLASGDVQGVQVEVVPSGQVVLASRAGFLDAVLDGGRDMELGRVTVAPLQRLAADKGADELVIVRVDDPQQVTLFDPGEGRFEQTQKERFASNFEEQRARWGPRGGASIGMGLSSIVSPRDDWDFQYYTVQVVAEFRILAGVYMDVAAALRTRRGQEDRTAVVLAPSTRIGLKYALKIKSTRPYLGVAGLTMVYGQDDVSLGVGGLAGVAFEFPRHPAVRIGVEVFGGRVRNWVMQITGQVGFYY